MSQREKVGVCAKDASCDTLNHFENDPVSRKDERERDR